MYLPLSSLVTLEIVRVIIISRFLVAGSAIVVIVVWLDWVTSKSFFNQTMMVIPAFVGVLIAQVNFTVSPVEVLTFFGPLVTLGRWYTAVKISRDTTIITFNKMWRELIPLTTNIVVVAIAIHNVTHKTMVYIEEGILLCSYCLLSST